MTLLAALLRSKVLVWTMLILAGLWPIWPLFVQQDSTALADPLKFVLHHWGLVACVLLAVVLTFTPLRVLFPDWDVAQALNRHRRLVGVSAFAYALLHFLAQTRYVYDGTWETFGREIQKPFQLIGLAALLILFLLAGTSFNAAVHWLGGRQWKNLHRMVYLAAALAAWHQAAARKIFPLQVVWIFGPVALLEIARAGKWWRDRRRILSRQ